MKTSRAAVCGVLGLSLAMSAWAQPSIPLVPRIPTGFSSVEQRYAYAPPDEGSFSFSLRSGNVFPTEVIIEEPMMCNGGKAEVDIRYSKRRNEVVLKAKFDKGLPYRMSYTRQVDVSTPYNQFPVSVEDGIWQIWFVVRMFNFHTNYYYDATTLQLIGAEVDHPVQPPGSFAISVPTLHMIASPLFEGEPDGDAEVRFKYRYDQMLDEQGMGGVYFSFIPSNLCKPDEYVPYYSKALPVEMAPNFDELLQSIHQGYGMAIATSLEPRVKPSWLLSRDNTMIGWGGAYPQVMPEGYESEGLRGTVRVKDTCGTRVAMDYPTGTYNLCTGF